MCGIVGLWEQEGRLVDRAVIAKMARVLKHRGPDDDGTVLFLPEKEGGRWRPSLLCPLDERDGSRGQGGLGHTRLRVIDLTQQARQPMANEDGTVWIAYNGEIYNFGVLRDELIRKGHRFRSQGDTEVVLHAYEEWGCECLARLNGMFAFGIVDLTRGELFLARDRLGIKPLYYYESQRLFAFASEPKALLLHDDIRVRLEPRALCDYLVLGYTPSPGSFFRDIRRLPPGHYLVRRLDAGKKADFPGRKPVSYWDVRLGETPGPFSEREYEEELLRRLSESVQARLISDVPLGAFLSGGVDSSAIVSRMAGVFDTEIRTFSIGFPEKEHNELQFAQQVSEKLGTLHRERILGADLPQRLSEILYFYDEPLADTSILPTFELCRLAKEHVTVCLSGDGSDELFGGYAQHATAARARDATYVPWFLRSLAARNRTLNADPGTTFSRLAGKVFGPSLQECIGVEAVPLQKWGEGLIRKELLRSMGSYSPYDVLNRYYRSCPARALPLDRIQSVDIKAYLPEDILTKVDRASMAFGLEVRVPFLDHRIVEFAARLPPAMRIREGTSKVILKRAFSNILPSEVLSRAKQGFAIPEAPWLLENHLPRIEQQLLGRDARIAEILAQDQLPHLFRKFREGSSYLARLIWGVYILEVWMKTMDRYGGIQVSTH